MRVERLGIMEETSEVFASARKRFVNSRPGEYSGIETSWRSYIRVANLVRYLQIPKKPAKAIII
jgi:RecG-like helicase